MRELARVGEEQRSLPAEHDDARNLGRLGVDVDAMPAVERGDPPEYLAGGPPSPLEERGGPRARRRRGCPRAHQRRRRRSIAVSASANADVRTRRNLARVEKSISDRAAPITIAASAEFGRLRSRSGKKSSIANGSRARRVPSPDDFAPDCSATAVRDALEETGNPWKRPAKALPAPIPIISWLASTSSPRLAAKLVDVAIVSASDTSAIPIAAANSGPMSLRSTDGNWGRGALRQRPHGRDAVTRQVEERYRESREDHGDQNGRDARREAREDQHQGE